MMELVYVVYVGCFIPVYLQLKSLEECGGQRTSDLGTRADSGSYHNIEGYKILVSPTSEEKSI